MDDFQKMNDFQQKCVILLSDFHYWENREFYVKLMGQFINGTIDGVEFEMRFYDMRNLDCQKKAQWEELVYIIDNLKLIQFQGFSSLISKLFTDCDVFEPDPMLREDYEISKK